MTKLMSASILLVVLSLLACSSTPEAAPAPDDGPPLPVAVTDEHNPVGRPVPVQDSFDLDVRTRLGYVRALEKSWKIPAWASHRLERSFYAPGARKFERLSRMLPDPDLQGEMRITHNHYTSTGLDRGAMAPGSALQGRTEELFRESYYMSNVAPQYPALSQHLWMHLESRVRKWAKTYGRIYVITGPIFAAPASDGSGLEPVAVSNWLTPAKPGLEEKIAIPTHFFKIVYRKTGGEMYALAFVMPNQEKEFADNWNFERWQVTVDVVESLTHFDVMSRLEDELEKSLESTREPIWD